MTTETTVIARNRMLDALGDDFYVALFISEPSEDGGGAEISTGAYARQAVSFASASGGERVSSTDVVFTPQVQDWTITSVGVFDAPTNGTLLMFQAVSEYIAPGQDLKIDAGTLTLRAT